MTTADSSRALIGSMRTLLVVAGVLVGLAGIQLFLFSERTDRFFAWTIEPPLTAAFLGASYWSSVAFEFAAARERLWANARIAIPTVFVFTALTLGVTIVHLDRFHLGAEFEAPTRAVTWAWIVIYAVVPVVMAVLWWVQQRQTGSDPTPVVELPDALRWLVGIQGLALAVAGVALLVAPTGFGAALWPWEVTALTGRAIGAWLVSLAVAAFHAVIENGARRLRPAAWAYIVFFLLQLWALARYPGDFRWDSTPGVVYLIFLASTVAVGISALRLSRRPE